MAIFGNKSIDCPPGSWTVLAETLASGMARTYTFAFEGEPVEGEYRVSKGVLPLGIGLSPASSGELRAQMSFEQGWFDVSYRIEVKPRSAVKAVRK